jgi:hypothetical protein
LGFGGGGGGGPTRARSEIQERRRIIGHNDKVAIQEPAVIEGVVRPHQERHHFGGTGAAEDIASPCSTGTPPWWVEQEATPIALASVRARCRNKRQRT